MNTKAAFGKSFQNFEFWLKLGIPKVYNFGPVSGAMYPQKNLNIAKNQNLCKNCIHP